MKIIFLDIDGVLINRSSLRLGYARVDPFCVANLNKIIKETNAHIVVSSTWRIGMSIIQLKDKFVEWGIKGKLLDKTPMLGYSCKRGEEIQDWLNSYKRHEIESFVIIDDDADMLHLMPRLVKTRFELGLQEEQALKAIQMLGE